MRDAWSSVAGRRLQRSVTLGMAVALAIGLVGFAAPQAARAADGVVSTASTTYELVPNKGVLRVTIDLSVTNNVPSGSRWVPCTEWVYDPWLGYQPVTSTCRQTIDYYLTGGYVVLERNARKIRITANRGTVSRSVDQKTDSFVGYTLKYAPVYRGQTRKIRITYEVPGGKPRSASVTRIGRAYTNFCVFANGVDRGSVRVIVPSAFDVRVQPDRMSSKRSGRSVVFTSGSLTDTASWYRCFEGTNAAGFARSDLTAASGRAVVLEGWPEDKAWRAAVTAEVRSALDGLETLVGRELPGTGPITIREVSDSELGAYAGTYDPDTGIARIGETYTEPGVVVHELSHAWFNDDAFAARWMSEGLAGWAEHISPTAGSGCSEPGTYPGKGPVDLDEWKVLGPKSTAAEHSVVDFQYQAACWIATAISTRIGDDRMDDVVQALLDRRAAYGDDPTDRRPGRGPVDWRTFVDLVDEVGLVPAGVTDLEFTQDLLLRFGVGDATALGGRSAARAAYHELAGDLGAWSMPDAIRSPLEAWRFNEALERIATARSVLERVAAADAALDGIDADEGPAKQAFEAADDADGLAEARAIAAAQADAAEDVAGALAALAEPLDTIEEIGMWGVDLQPRADEAVAAVRAADEAAAGAAADDIRDQLARATDVGTQRVAFGAVGGVAALLLLAGIAVLVRRRRRPSVEPEAAPPMADPWASPAIQPMEPEAASEQMAITAGHDAATEIGPGAERTPDGPTRDGPFEG